MEISNVIVLGVVILILLAFTVFIMEMFLPLQLKSGVHEICRPYLYILEANGDLEPMDIKKIESHLKEIGLETVVVTLERQGHKFGDLVTLSIKGIYNHQPMVNLFKRAFESLEFNYEKQISVRKILN